MLVPGGGPAYAQQAILSAEQILAALDHGPPLPPKAILPKANPDAATHVCDAELDRCLTSESGLRGEYVTRNLCVEGEPAVDLDIAFALGEAVVLAQGRAQLDALARGRREPRLADQRFVLAGHTDIEGSADCNDRLSCERALSARRYLVEQHDVAVDRLLPMGFGYQKLEDPAHPRAAANGRVDIRRFAGLERKGQP